MTTATTGDGGSASAKRSLKSALEEEPATKAAKEDPTVKEKKEDDEDKVKVEVKKEEKEDEKNKETKEKKEKKEKKDKEHKKEKKEKKDKLDGTPPKKKIDLKELDQRKLFKDGQRNMTPPVADPTRGFYESLLRENPESKVAIKFCVENGVFPLEKHKQLLKKYNHLRDKGAFSVSAQITRALLKREKSSDKLKVKKERKIEPN